MTNLVDFRVTDLITQVLAEQYNRVIDATLRAELANTETLAANKTLTDADFVLQVLAPTADRDVTLPALGTANHPFVIINAGAFGLVVKNSGGTVIGGVASSNSASFVSNGSTWYLFSTANLPTAGPAGEMINGKIVASVASNNLTLAIKTLAGANPSVADPVYVRIGDTLRSITAALSVTRNAGTNWCNLGLSEHAAQDVDLFAYLGYNATDGVVLGFARFPGATAYSDFSTTAANYKYAAISTTTNATSTDVYENIGRFNVSMSLAAAFNWSIPGTAIVISRPMFESRWMTWAPVQTTYSATPTNAVYRYRLIGSIVDVTFAQGTAGTSNGTTIGISAPFAAKTLTNLKKYAAAYVTNNSVLEAGFALITSAASTIDVLRVGGAFTGSGGKMASFQLQYEY